jgi:carnitine O-palmitoyltransferase 2
MFALRKMHEIANPSLPPVPLYTHPALALLNHNVLSTSTLVSPHLNGGGFGPVVSDGWGIGYGTTDDGIAFVITTYNGREQLDRFVGALEDALVQVRNTLVHETTK